MEPKGYLQSQILYMLYWQARWDLEGYFNWNHDWVPIQLTWDRAIFINIYVPSLDRIILSTCLKCMDAGSNQFIKKPSSYCTLF